MMLEADSICVWGSIHNLICRQEHKVANCLNILCKFSLVINSPSEMLTYVFHNLRFRKKRKILVQMIA